MLTIKINSMENTVSYFIKKFEAIPEDKWCAGYDTNSDKRCAYGHCGGASEEAVGLLRLFRLLSINISPVGVNDGFVPQYQQPTPKQRILAALGDIKKIQTAEPKEERTRVNYVSVPESIKEKMPELVYN